ncbi:MAG TPA: hypothetical protein VGL70_06745 [Candidatus Binatia bacterium]|jgi:hypothetical protein
MKTFAGLIALLFFFAGCSASGPHFKDTRYAKQPAPADRARIIFFREPDGDFRSVELDVDDQIIGKLAGGEFLVEDAVPGERGMTASLKGEFMIKMKLEGGQTYYIRVSPREEATYKLIGFFSAVGSWMSPADAKGHFKLQRVGPEVALAALEQLSLSE